jgi:PAS domain S-box-containing protein
MKNRDKDKKQLQDELTELRKKITELEGIKTSQKQTEKKLTKPEEMYHLIAENTSDVITLTTFNLHPVYTYVSPSIKTNTGVKKLLTGKELPTTKRIELRFKDKNGNWHFVQSTGNIVGNQLLFITRDITASKQTEESLIKSRQEFISLFNSSPEALVYTDERSNILDVNPRFSELFGYTLEEIKGRNLDDGMIHHPDKIEEGKELGRIAKSKGYFTCDTIRKKKDGTLFPVSISGSNITIDGQLKGMLVIYIDTTERKSMLDKLKKSEEKFRHLFENMPGAYYRIDRDGNLVMINPEGAKLFGYNFTEDISGKNISKHLYFAPEERKKYLKELENNKGNLKDHEIILKKRDGSPLVISDTSHYYYDREGNIAGVEGIFVDITERKKTEEALQKSQQEFSSLFKSNPEALVYLDEKGTILDANLRFCEL